MKRFFCALFLVLGLASRGSAQPGPPVPTATTIPVFTVATLPAASSMTGRTVMVWDGATGGTCTAGGGGYRNLCQSNGASWITLSGGGSVPEGRTLTATAPLTGGGDLTANRAFACPTCEITTRKGAANGYAGLDVGGVVLSSQGGTGNAFTKFTGPTTTEKTFTLPDASGTLGYFSGTPGTGFVTKSDATGLVAASATSTGYSNEWRGSGYASINDLVTAAASTVGQAIIEGTLQAVTTGPTIPNTLTLVIRGAGTLKCNGQTITINGGLDAPKTQIFDDDCVSGPGKIVFTNNLTVPIVYPEWWGVKKDGSDSLAKMNAMLAAVGTTGMTVQLLRGTYTVSDNLNQITTNGTRILGLGQGVTTLYRNVAPATACVAATDPCGLLSVSAKNVEIAYLTLRGDGTDWTSTPNLKGKGIYGHPHGTNLVSDLYVHDVEVKQVTGEAVYMDGDSPRTRVTHCYVHDTSMNAINFNTGGLVSADSEVSYNTLIDNGASAIQVGARSITVIGNIIRSTGPLGADLLLVADSQKFTVADNILYDTDNGAGVASGIMIYRAQTATRVTIDAAGSPGLSRSGTTVTVKVTGGHVFTTGDIITIAGADDSTFNGIFPITRLSATQFSYAQTGATTTSGGGTATNAHPMVGTVTNNTVWNVKSRNIYHGGSIAVFEHPASGGLCDGTQTNITITNNLIGGGGQVLPFSYNAPAISLSGDCLTGHVLVAGNTIRKGVINQQNKGIRIENGNEAVADGGSAQPTYAVPTTNKIVIGENNIDPLIAEPYLLNVAPGGSSATGSYQTSATNVRRTINGIEMQNLDPSRMELKEANLNLIPFAAPDAATATITARASGGVLSAGNYSYKITFVTTPVTDLETDPGTVSNVVTAAGVATEEITLSAIPLGPTGVTKRKIYRTAAGGATYKLVTTLSDNTTTTYIDNLADASLGATAATTNTTHGNLTIYHIKKGSLNEGLILGWTGPTAQIQTSTGGGGTARQLGIYYGGLSSIAILVPTAITSPLDLAAIGLTSAATTGRVRVGGGVNNTATSGTHYEMLVNGGAAPTATSTLNFRSLAANFTVNYSNGTPGAGTWEALSARVTETANPTGKNYFLRFLGGTAATQDIFGVTNKTHIETGQGTPPGLDAGCGTGATIVGTDTSGRITTNATAFTTCKITFTTAWTNIPQCFIADETTAMTDIKPIPTAADLTFVGSGITGNDVLSYFCIGRV